MATSVIPKSEIRVNNNIAVGFGEVPAVECSESGRMGWGLPGGKWTSCKETAHRWAEKLDREISRAMKSPAELLKTVRYIV